MPFVFHYLWYWGESINVIYKWINKYNYVDRKCVITKNAQNTPIRYKNVYLTTLVLNALNNIYIFRTEYGKMACQ